MHVLFQLKDPSISKEILEYIEGHGSRVSVSHSSEESIRLISTNRFDKMVISIRNLRDAVILKYIQEYYPELPVVVLANRGFDELLSLFQKTRFTVIHEPLRLSDLKKELHMNML